MKKLFKQRIKISILWIPYLFIFLPIFGKKLWFFIFMMLTIHESAHILVAILLGYKLQCVRVYPFGLAAQIQYMGFGDTRKECLIVLAGPLMHVSLLPLLLLLFMRMSWISESFYVYLCTMNKAFFLFNILPIYPLDGGRILQCILHSIFSYKLAQKLMLIMSGVFLTWCLYVRIFQGLSSYILVCFIYLQIWLGFHNLVYDAYAFYQYRFQHALPYPIFMHKKDDLYRMRHNVIISRYGLLDERAWISCKLLKRGVGDR